MSDQGCWTAGELRGLGFDVGVSRSGAILRIDCRGGVPQVDDAFFARLNGLDRLRELNLSGCAISERAVQALLVLAELRTLSLENARIAAEALEQLAGLPQLELLIVRGTGLSTERLAELRRRRIRVRIVS